MDETNPYKRIKARLIELNKTATWLAKQINVGQSWMSKALSGEHGLEARFRDIAEVLQVSIDWLWNGAGDESGMYRAIITDQQHKLLVLELRLKQYEHDYARSGRKPPRPLPWAKPDMPPAEASPDSTP